MVRIGVAAPGQPTSPGPFLLRAISSRRAARDEGRSELFQQRFVLRIGEPTVAADDAAIRSGFRLALFPNGGDEDSPFLLTEAHLVFAEISRPFSRQTSRAGRNDETARAATRALWREGRVSRAVES